MQALQLELGYSMIDFSRRLCRVQGCDVGENLPLTVWVTSFADWAGLIGLNSSSGGPSDQPGTPFRPSLFVCVRVCAGSIEVVWIRRLWIFSSCPRIGRSLPLTKKRGSTGN